MVHRLPISFAHTKPINHDDILFPQIIHDKIFPRTSGQARKNTFKWTLIYQTLFQGKWKPLLRTKTLLKDLTMNKSFLEGIHQTLSSLSRLTQTEYYYLKKEAKTSISQSWAALTKLIFHWVVPPKNSKWAAIEESFAQTVPNNMEILGGSTQWNVSFVRGVWLRSRCLCFLLPGVALSHCE
jgi:hypothetical protein